MNSCACCGQPLPSQERVTVRVDDELLRLCNLAYDDALQRQSGAVEIAHLVLCLAMSPAAGELIEGFGARRASLASAARDWLDRVSAGRCTGGVPRTSVELKTLLMRAERLAGQTAGSFAGIRDLVLALFQEASDLGSAEFVSSARSGGSVLSQGQGSGGYARPAGDEGAAWAGRGAYDLSGGWPFADREHDPLRVRRERQLRFDFEARRRAEDQREASTTWGTREAEPGAREQRYREETSALRQRLAQQEEDISELRSMLARMAERRHEPAQGLARSGGRVAGATGPVDESLCEDEATESEEGARPGRPASRLGRSRLVRRVGGRALTARPRSARSSERDVARARGASRSDGESRQPRIRLVHGAADDGDALPGDGDSEPECAVDGGSDRLKRFYLSPDDDIVKAPSIGPRTAARLVPAGLALVRDLLACDPAEVATRAAARYITVDRVAEWKAQARLVCTIPWLRGTHAQLLVGAGYDTLAKIMRADVGKLSAAVLRFAATREGQSILRSAPAPEIDRIACWIENTALAEPGRAA